MTTTTAINRQLLERAADFIERHPNGADPLIKVLMAQAIRGTIKAPTSKPRPEPANDTSVPEDNIGILLRAAGWRRVTKSVRKVYGFLLRHQTKAWNAAAVADATGANKLVTRNILGRLVSRGAIERVGVGQYRAK